MSSSVQKAQKFSSFPVSTLQAEKSIWQQEAIQLLPEQRQGALSQVVAGRKQEEATYAIDHAAICY